jgi:hypothetical protein
MDYLLTKQVQVSIRTPKLQTEIPQYCMGRFPNIAEVHCRHYLKPISLYLTTECKEERRMLTMDKVHDIRSRFFKKGQGISQIAGALNVDRKTVQKYVDMTDFNEPPPKPASKQRLCPKLDPYKSAINDWLVADKEAPRKQRHTAKKVFDRLKKEVVGFDCSYRTVATYYAVKLFSPKLFDRAFI